MENTKNESYVYTIGNFNGSLVTITHTKSKMENLKQVLSEIDEDNITSILMHKSSIYKNGRAAEITIPEITYTFHDPINMGFSKNGVFGNVERILDNNGFKIIKCEMVKIELNSCKFTSICIKNIVVEKIKTRSRK